MTLWTVACQAPLSMGFSRQEYWSGLPCPPPGDLHDPRMEPESSVSPELQVDSLPLSHQESPSKVLGGTNEVRKREKSERMEKEEEKEGKSGG